MELEQICQGAKAASQKLATLGTNEKNRALTAVASALVAASADIIAANKEDLENGKKNHMPEGLLDRLMLNEARIAQIAEGLQQVAALDDPIGEVLSMKKRPNGLMIGKKRVPLGVVGMIYEARPNVTVDAFGLCFKTGNAVILKGGSDAIVHFQLSFSLKLKIAYGVKRTREVALLFQLTADFHCLPLRHFVRHGHDLHREGIGLLNVHVIVARHEGERHDGYQA